MAGRGGYQPPANPAPVSGPGALSQRTDGGPGDKQAIRRLPNAGYGESKAFEEIQGGAPMGSAPEPSAGSMPFAGPRLSDPSGRPDEPVTAGADVGAGPGSSALGIPNEDQGDIQAILGKLHILEFMVNQPDASPTTRAMIRRIKSQL